jgi:5-methylcytosine-specific restriction endonuclease McrA
MALTIIPHLHDATMHTHGYSPSRIVKFILEGRDLACGRGRKKSPEVALRKVNDAIHNERQSFYDGLWGHWCSKHQTQQEFNSEGRWRCPVCRREITQAGRARRRACPIFRAAEKKRYREWLKKRIASSPEIAAKYKAIDKRWEYKRRALLEANPLTAETLLAFWNTYDRCLKCGTVDDITIDHVVPLSKGGGSEFLNLQCLCRVCNSTKNAADTDYRVRIPEK